MTNPTPDSGQSGAAPSGAPSGAPPVAAPEPTDPTAVSNRDFVHMRKQLAAKEKELEALRAQSMTEQEKAVAAARVQGADEYRGKYLAMAKTNAVLAALAAKGVVAPELALGALNIHEIDVDEATGRVDSASLDQKIDEVLKRYPMLGPAGSASQSFASGGDQRHVSGNNLAAMTSVKDGKMDPKGEAMLRWALGGREPG